MGDINEKRGHIAVLYKWINHVSIDNAEWENDSFYVANATIEEADKALKEFHAKYQTEYVITGHVASYSYE